MNGLNKVNRGYKFSKKILRSYAKCFYPEVIRNRFVGPKIISNSVPKSGTNLMENILSLFPGLRMAPRRTLMSWNGDSDAILAKMKKLKKGQFINAHLPYSSGVELELSNLGIRALFLIRDPRDVVVSHFKYVTEIDKTHYAHKYFSEIADDNRRLVEAIVGVKDVVVPVRELWDRFGDWINNPETLVIKYEDIVGNDGGGNAATQKNTIEKIASHIGMKLSDNDLDYILTNAYSKKSATFRQGKLGKWREYFKPEHVELFKRETGDLLIRLGYENNYDWGVS